MAPLKALLEWFSRRAFRGVKVRVAESRMAGGRKTPALVITFAVENPQGENAFVDELDVRMLEPFEATATEYEFRDAQREGIPRSLPLNIPAFGISEAMKVIAHFAEPLPDDDGSYRAEIAAAGRSGFRKRYTTIRGNWDWRR